MTAPVVIPSMTPVPPFPALSDRASGAYNSMAYAFGTHMSGVFNTELTAIAAACRTNAISAQESATAGGSSAGTATTKATEAAASALAADTSKNAAAASAVAAANSETAAAASAASAAAIAGAFVGTSTSSVTIGAGTKNFVTQAGEQYTPGMFLVAASTANPANYVAGQVLTYAGTALSMDASVVGGSGTFASWNLSLAGPQGAKGDQGVPGPAFTGGSLTSAVNEARATVASHATTAAIWSALGNQIDWTGTATTTAFPAAPQAGAVRELVCAAACSFTAGANMLIDGVASGQSVTCAANDIVVVRAISATQFRLTRIKYDGTAQVSSSRLIRSPRTSNTALAVADLGTMIDITSGTFTQAFAAAATLGSGWWCHLRNSNTLPIDINGSFDSANKWTLGSGVAITGGQLVMSSAGSPIATSNPSPLVAGIQYEVEFDLVNSSGGGSYVLLNAGGANVTLTNTANGASSVQAAASGKYRGVFTASAPGLIFQNTSGFGINGTIDNVVLRTTSGDITLDPNASETIDGLVSFIMYPGEMRLIQCDGTSFYSTVLNSFYRKWTSTATNNFTRPPGYKDFAGFVKSGGQGGGLGSSGVGARGGSGGGNFPFTFPSSLFSAQMTFTIGAGGVGTSTPNASGPSGGDSQLGSLVLVRGGATSLGGSVSMGGVQLQTTAAQCVGFEATNKDDGTGISIYGGARSPAFTAPSYTMYGGPSGGSTHSNGGSTFPAGANALGATGGVASTTGVGGNGVGAGAGGGASSTGSKAGDGIAGEIEMWGVF